MITPEQLRLVLKKHHWTLSFSTSGKQQVYAAKQRWGKRLATCYIATSNRLNDLTEADVVAKINRKAAERLDGQRGSINDQAPTEQKPNDRAYMPALPIIRVLQCNPIAGG